MIAAARAEEACSRVRTPPWRLDKPGNPCRFVNAPARLVTKDFEVFCCNLPNTPYAPSCHTKVVQAYPSEVGCYAQDLGHHAGPKLAKTESAPVCRKSKLQHTCFPVQPESLTHLNTATPWKGSSHALYLCSSCSTLSLGSCRFGPRHHPLSDRRRPVQHLGHRRRRIRSHRNYHVRVEQQHHGRQPHLPRQ